jgi:hypothetical protein
MAKDFRGQDLRGRSFKGQELAVADFSWADLTGAKFCNARMGRTLKMSFSMFWLQLITGIFAGVIAIAGSILLMAFIEKYFSRLEIRSDALFSSIITPTYTLLLSYIIALAINHKNRYYIFYFLCLFMSFGLAIAMITGTPYSSGALLNIDS